MKIKVTQTSDMQDYREAIDPDVPGQYLVYNEEQTKVIKVVTVTGPIKQINHMENSKT